LHKGTLKIKISRTGARNVVPTVEHMLCKHEALSLNPSPVHKKKKNPNNNNKNQI
jgi:hypothetical protein